MYIYIYTYFGWVRMENVCICVLIYVRIPGAGTLKIAIFPAREPAPGCSGHASTKPRPPCGEEKSYT